MELQRWDQPGDHPEAGVKKSIHMGKLIVFFGMVNFVNHPLLMQRHSKPCWNLDQPSLSFAKASITAQLVVFFVYIYLCSKSMCRRHTF